MAKSTTSLIERARRMVLRSKSRAQLESALNLLKQAAAADNPEAHYAIGTWYLFGRVLKKDAKKAAKHFSTAAAKGSRSAMFDLALLNEKGHGVPKNLRRAYGLYIRAAQQGDEDAMKSVVRCLYHGIGTARDKLAAILLEDLTTGKPSIDQQRKRAKRARL